MDTNEIIRRLDGMLHHPRLVDVCKDCLSDNCEDCEAVQETKETLNLAILAVKTLEEIKATGKGKCKFCKHLAADTTELPCRDCFDDNDLWEFRWPLSKGTAE